MLSAVTPRLVRGASTLRHAMSTAEIVSCCFWLLAGDDKAVNIEVQKIMLSPIRFGGRLSGNLNKDLRIGLMSLQTGNTNDFLGQNVVFENINEAALIEKAKLQTLEGAIYRKFLKLFKKNLCLHLVGGEKLHLL